MCLLAYKKPWLIYHVYLKFSRKISINTLTGETSNLIKDLRSNLVGIISNIEVNIDYPEYEDIEVKYQVKVVDGDSLEINSIRIRLMGIDAPEYTQTCKTNANKKYYCGQDSINHLKKLIENKTITCKTHQKDQYDRELCTCYADDTDINKEMVRSGHAIVYLESNYHQDQAYACRY